MCIISCLWKYVSKSSHLVHRSRNVSFQNFDMRVSTLRIFHWVVYTRSTFLSWNLMEINIYIFLYFLFLAPCEITVTIARSNRGSWSWFSSGLLQLDTWYARLPDISRAKENISFHSVLPLIENNNITSEIIYFQCGNQGFLFFLWSWKIITW